MPSRFRRNEKAGLDITTFIASLSEHDVDAVELAGNVGAWLIDYLQCVCLTRAFRSDCRLSFMLSELYRELLTNLEEGCLWDIWYTGLSPFPSEVRTPLCF
jgi:hypothetical protein